MSIALSPSASLSVALLALTVEAAAGWPAPLYARIGHPVTWMGRLIGFLDRLLNRETLAPTVRRLNGVVALLVLLAVVGGIAVAITSIVFPALRAGPVTILVLGLLAATLPAQRSLDAHVRAVADGLSRGLDTGRAAVSQIVGRDPATLDEAGVARAAVESLAENFSDGVVAPIFWTAAGGLVGGALYKAINTADSMIGHRTARHLQFGWAAARLDDLVNLPASRLAALWLVVAAAIVPGASPLGAIRAVRRDAGAHTSPNAGWPEAAMAGALGFALAGPRVYGGRLVDGAHMGDGRRDLGVADIRAALTLYRTALFVQAAALVLTLAVLA